MLTENGARFVVNNLPPGSMTIFPKVKSPLHVHLPSSLGDGQGAIHFEVNDGCGESNQVLSGDVSLTEMQNLQCS